MPGADRVHPNMENIYTWQPLHKGNSEKVPEIIDDAPYAVEGSFYSSREPHMSIEGDTIQAYYDEDGLLTVQCKSMTTYFDRDDIAQAVGLDVEQVRVVENPTGGSFGWAMNAASYALAAIACKVMQMPVALYMDYEQFMAFSGKRAPSYTNGRLACDKDGKIIAGEFDVGVDHGYDPALGDDLLFKIARFIFFPYYIPNALGLCRAAVTNHSAGVPYRGYGSPQAYTSGEALVDMLAEQIGMDPFEFRYKNIARSGQTNVNSSEFLQYPMEEMMDKMKPLYDKAVEEVKNQDTPVKRRGVGLAWGGYNVGLGSDDFANVAIELAGDGKFIKYDTWQDQGQGGDQGSLICTLEALKPYFPDVTPDNIRLVQADTKLCPNTGESAGSRSHFVNGKASILAAQKLANAMRKEDGSYRTYEEMINEGIPTCYEGNWVAEAEWDCFLLPDPNTGQGSCSYAYTYALYMAEIEVDVATGKTTVLGMTCVDWVGKVGNIQAVDGQAYGGISHSIGFALSENYEDVRKDTNMFLAGVPYIKEIPDKMDVIHMDGFDERGPFGSSGASEAFQSGDHMAVINAINYACGVRVYELPATPQKVKAGLELLAAGGRIDPPKKYYLGPDFYDEIERLKNNPV